MRAHMHDHATPLTGTEGLRSHAHDIARLNLGFGDDRDLVVLLHLRLQVAADHTPLFLAPGSLVQKGPMTRHESDGQRA